MRGGPCGAPSTRCEQSGSGRPISLWVVWKKLVDSSWHDPQGTRRVFCGLRWSSVQFTGQHARIMRGVLLCFVLPSLELESQSLWQSFETAACTFGTCSPRRFQDAAGTLLGAVSSAESLECRKRGTQRLDSLPTERRSSRGDRCPGSRLDRQAVVLTGRRAPTRGLQAQVRVAMSSTTPSPAIRQPCCILLHCTCAASVAYECCRSKRTAGIAVRGDLTHGVRSLRRAAQ